jgi:hypothetical protein
VLVRKGVFHRPEFIIFTGMEETQRRTWLVVVRSRIPDYGILKIFGRLGFEHRASHLKSRCSTT